MAAKRRAGTELTDRNWEDEEEQEEAGSFEMAGKETLARRVIKKAKRRFKVGGVDDSEQDDAPKPSPFAGFAFGANKPSSAGFSFKPTTKTETQTLPSFSFKPSIPDKPPAAPSTSANTPSPPAFGSAKVASIPVGTNGTGALTSSPASKPGSQYTVKLQNLNRSVSSWIQKHVQENPVCDLTPVFEDYKKHLREIEKLRTDSSVDAGNQQAEKKPNPPAPNPSIASTFSFGQTSTKADATPTNTMTFAPSTSSTFSFGKSSEVGQPKSDFSFKSQASTTSTTSTTASGFSFRSGDAPKSAEFSAGKLEGSGTSSLLFGSAKPFSFGIAKSTDSPVPASEEKKTTEEEDYVPPKEEVKTVEEKDSLYSKKCKLYYKKGSAYVDRGVGMLHLKKLTDTLQLLVRADTNLGNAILNVSLPQSLPVSRQGKNNLIIMTPLNPPAERNCPQCNKKYPSPQDSNACDSGCTPEAIALLVRVKTSEDADEVLEKINELRGA